LTFGEAENSSKKSDADAPVHMTTIAEGCLAALAANAWLSGGALNGRRAK
jgi:hypothetical protein